MKLLLILKILIKKIIRLNLAFLKRQISGYPKSVEEFENNFAKYIGKKYAISFCNGTSSIEAAIFALNFSKDDEILVPSSTFHASIGPIKNLNCKPVFVDVDLSTFNISLKDLERKISSKTKALMLVHVLGNSVDMKKLTNIIKRRKIILIEDTCESLGAKFGNP